MKSFHRERHIEMQEVVIQEEAITIHFTIAEAKLFMKIIGPTTWQNRVDMCMVKDGGDILGDIYDSINNAQQNKERKEIVQAKDKKPDVDVLWFVTKTNCPLRTKAGNLRVTFDGETGDIKSAEVIK